MGFHWRWFVLVILVLALVVLLVVLISGQRLATAGRRVRAPRPIALAM